MWRAQRGENFAFVTLARAARRKIVQRQAGSPVFLWYLARAARRTFCFCYPGARSAEKIFAFCNPGARSAEKNLSTLDWVTRFLWYVARAARRKFCFCNLGARSTEKNCATPGWVTRFSLVSGARSAENILLLLPWRAQRGENFCFLQPWRAQRGEKFCHARLGHPFSLVSRNAGATLGQR